MKTITNVAHVLARITGVIQILLGAVIWFGVADALIPFHILSGIILVLSLWTLAIAAAQVGANVGLAVFAAAWGLIAVILGLVQERLIPNQGHWIIQIIHLIVGLVIIGLAERLAVLITKRQTSAVNN